MYKNIYTKRENENKSTMSEGASGDREEAGGRGWRLREMGGRERGRAASVAARAIAKRSRIHQKCIKFSACSLKKY